MTEVILEWYSVRDHEAAVFTEAACELVDAGLPRHLLDVTPSQQALAQRLAKVGHRLVLFAVVEP